MDVFSPLTLGGRTFPSRSVLAPMVLNLSTPDGRMTPALIASYEARAKAGLGYVVLGATFVLAEGRGFAYQSGIHDDAMLPGLGEFAARVGSHCPVGLQLSYKTMGRPADDFHVFRIKAIREAFGAAAVRARQAGFTAVELHACHDYLLNYFLSPHFNHRSDQYGGPLANRFRLLKEVVEEVRARVGGDLLLGVRLSLEEFVPDGLRLAETLEVGSWLAELKVDYLSASAGIGPTQFRVSPPSEVRRAPTLLLARALRETVGLPVIGVGRLDRPAEFQAAVAEGHADLAAAGRALLADPEFVAKQRDGREKEIRPCLACNYCLGCIQRNEPLACAVNPWLGHEAEPLPPLPPTAKVLVLGGGPAGLTAAAVAARRGASVRLVEKNASLGGTLPLASLPPGKEPLGELAEQLAGEARRAGVAIETGRELAPAEIASGGYDQLVVATGALPIELGLPGLDLPGVVGPGEALRQGSPAPGAWLVVGGGLVGLEVAEHLAELGARVAVIEMAPEMGRGLVAMRAGLIMEKLIRGGATLLTATRLAGLEPGLLARVTVGERPTRLGPFAGVALCVGYRSPSPRGFAGAAPLVAVIGDAQAPRSVAEAMREGRQAGLQLG